MRQITVTEEDKTVYVIYARILFSRGTVICQYLGHR